MRDSLLWVYEGQTQFWGFILAARSGLMPAEDVRGELARTAAFYDTLPGRAWRPLIDTTNDPTVQGRRPTPWPSWMRGEDYYSEGMLIWLEVDARLRQMSGGRRSIDDFARAFFGVNPGDQGLATYTFDDVVHTLNAIQPFDWATYLRDRVYRTGPAPLAWIQAGGYRLVYRDTPPPYFTSRERDRKVFDLTYSIGATIGEAGRIIGRRLGFADVQRGRDCRRDHRRGQRAAIFERPAAPGDQGCTRRPRSDPAADQARRPLPGSGGRLS